MLQKRFLQESIEEVNELKFLVELEYNQRAESGKVVKSAVYEVTFETKDFTPMYDFYHYVVNKIIPRYTGQSLQSSISRRMYDDIITAIKTKGKGGNGLDSLWRGFIVFSTFGIISPSTIGVNVGEDQEVYYGYFKVRNVRLIKGEPRSNSEIVEAAKNTSDFQKFIHALKRKNYKFVGIRPGGELADLNPQRDRALLLSWLETFVLDYYLKNFEMETE
jgi:hypothetical protein